MTWIYGERTWESASEADAVEPTEPGEKNDVATAPAVTAARLATLPEALRAELALALTQLDADAVARAIAAIRSCDDALAHELTILARDFQYERMLRLLQCEGGLSDGGASL